MYLDLEAIVRETAEVVRPPERLTVAEAAEKYRYINNRGSYVGPWRNSTTPYLVEPMEALTDRGFTEWVFVSASQSGKTDSFLNFLTYTVVCDPSDIMLVEVSQERAGDFSKRRIDRLHRASPEVGNKILHRPHMDNVTSKRYTTGTMLNLGWPSITALSGRPIRFVFLTDYDRMPLDVEGEGSAFGLARARITSFGRHGMVAAESSPSHPVLDPQWVPGTPHEAPPAEGILSLYNRGDRRRWYWTCIDCGNAFEPAFALLRWDEHDDPMKSAESARMECPHCARPYTHGADIGPGKHAMNLRGFWMKDGQRWNRREQRIEGEAFRSDMASFWLQGVAAAFKDWRTIVLNWLQANQEYLRTGSESALQTTVNTDQAQPYTPKSHEVDRLPEVLRSRAFDFGYKVVPEQARFLVAAVDVQKTRFVVQVVGVGYGADLWVIDRFDIRYSRREDTEKPGQFHRVRPFTYREDWRLLLDEVVLRTYELGDGSGRRMAIKVTVCDSGGMDAATANAYAFWRWLKTGPASEDEDRESWEDTFEKHTQLHQRFQLYRGETRNVPKRVEVTYPDSGRRARFAGARGEIPLLVTNTTPIKNELDSRLDRVTEGTGKINFASWLNLNFFKELTVETKDLKGLWQNPRGFRNESWDLFVMALAVMISTRHIGIERVDWDDPPTWARVHDENDLVFMPEPEGDTVEPFVPARKTFDGLSDLARELA